MRSLLLTFTLAFAGVTSVAGVLNFVEHHLLPQPAQATATSNPVVVDQLVAPQSRPLVQRRPATAAAPTVRRPKIRVGLYSSDEAMTVQVTSKSNLVAGEAETRLTNISANQSITLSYDRATAQYTVTSASFTTTTPDYIKVQPLQPHTVTTITSYTNTPAWDDTINDNQFFGAIELRYVASTDTVWVINELGIENYVKGVAEAGDDNTVAYLKTLYTAARSYAYYHYLHPTKHADEYYVLDATANDQVYRGYGFTSRAPNIVAAVEATTGYIVHYAGEPVVTPYFSQSDGRTRAWSEVWSGDYPYLLSVDDPACSGDELLGHGVGLSAKGARYFGEQNWHWREILQYYYQGIALQQLW
jgi:peptidoglycan hydrolase-like amidase